MSAWSVHVVRAISEAVDSRPCEGLTVEDLSEFAFPGTLLIEKKHRVAAIRAMRRIAQQRPDLILSRAKLLGGRGRMLLILFHQTQRESVRESLRPRKMWLLHDQDSCEWIQRRFDPALHEQPIDRFGTTHFTAPGDCICMAA